MSKFGNRPAVLHVCSIAAGSEDGSNLHLVICIRRSNECSGSIIDERSKLDGYTLHGLSRLPNANQ